MIITEQLIETLTSTDINFSLNQIIKSPSQARAVLALLLCYYWRTVEKRTQKNLLFIPLHVLK